MGYDRTAGSGKEKPFRELYRKDGATGGEIAVIAVTVTSDKYEPNDVLETICHDVNTTWIGS